MLPHQNVSDPLDPTLMNRYMDQVLLYRQQLPRWTQLYSAPQPVPHRTRPCLLWVLQRVFIPLRERVTDGHSQISHSRRAKAKTSSGGLTARMHASQQWIGFPQMSSHQAYGTQQCSCTTCAVMVVPHVCSTHTPYRSSSGQMSIGSWLPDTTL